MLLNINYDGLNSTQFVTNVGLRLKMMHCARVHSICLKSSVASMFFFCSFV